MIGSTDYSVSAYRSTVQRTVDKVMKARRGSNPFW